MFFIQIFPKHDDLVYWRIDVSPGLSFTNFNPSMEK